MTQNYESLNMADLFEEAERFDNQGNTNAFLGNFARMPEKEGFVVVRLLPPSKGKKWYCATRTHRLDKINLHCPRELSSINGQKRWLDVDLKDPCPVCKYYNSLYRDADDAEGADAENLIEAAKKIKPIERYYYNCIVREQVNDKGEMERNVGPKILSIGKTLHEKIIRFCIGDEKIKKKGLGDVSDVKTGRDLKIVKKIKRGKEGYPYYDESEFLDPSLLGDKDQIDLWLSTLHDLAALRKLRPTSEMAVFLKKYLGLIPDDDNDTSFNINEYKRQSNVTKPVTVSVPETVTIEPANSDVAMTEAEFLESLNKVKK